MFEIAGLFLVMLIVAGSAFFPLGYAIFWDASKKGQRPVALAEAGTGVTFETTMPEDSVLKRHCLTNLQTEVEAIFAPRPTDSVLQRHHDSIVAFELEKRLQDLQLTA